MESTYKNFLRLANLFEYPERDINIVALQYRKSENPIQFAHIFCSLYPYMITQVAKYYSLTDSDKASICVEELNKSIRAFKLTKNASVQTLFSVYLNNRIRAELEKLSRIKRKADNRANQEEFVDSYIYEEWEFETIDTLESLKSFNLTPNELRYCEIILRDSGKVLDVDIAKALGVSSAAITYIKNRLMQKLDFAI